MEVIITQNDKRVEGYGFSYTQIILIDQVRLRLEKLDKSCVFTLIIDEQIECGEVCYQAYVPGTEFSSEGDPMESIDKAIIDLLATLDCNLEGKERSYFFDV